MTLWSKVVVGTGAIAVSIVVIVAAVDRRQRRDEATTFVAGALRDRLDAVEQAVGGLLPGLPPDVCVDLGHVGVRSAALADRLAGVGVAHHDLGVLRGAVHASHESHVRDPTSPGEPSLPAPTRGETAE